MCARVGSYIEAYYFLQITFQFSPTSDIERFTGKYWNLVVLLLIELSGELHSCSVIGGRRLLQDSSTTSDAPH